MRMLQLTAREQLHTLSYTTPKDEEQVTHMGILLVKAIRDGGGCGLVDDAQHLQASDGAGILRGLQ